jgi:micrococcal nuclease
MKKILLVLLFICFPLTAHAWMAKVVSVTDGDTIKVYNAEQGQVKVRLYGIDTPEKGQAFGKAAGKHLALEQRLKLNLLLKTVMGVQ